MADYPLVNLPDIGGDTDIWGQELNDAARELETRINAVKDTAETALSGTSGASDSLVAGLVSNPTSLVHTAIDAMTVHVGTGPTDAAAGDHNHDSRYTTPAQVSASISAAVAGSGSGIAGAPTSWPATFPPDVHTHTASQISDSTAVGRAVLKATDAQAARTAIGAGTGNGTSNLTIGPSGTQAAAGNHGHTASAINLTTPTGMTSTNVQDGIAELSARPSGGSGTGTSVDVLYASGAYPTQAATPPAGVKVRHFYGPVRYVGATWAGVLDTYMYAELT